jgi:hypothetical protein
VPFARSQVARSANSLSLTSSLESDKLTGVSQPTPTYQLIEERLDGTLADFVRARRPAAPPASWRQIASEIKELTGVEVTHESLRKWFADDARTEQGSAA